MKKFYSLLACAGMPEQGENYSLTRVRIIVYALIIFALNVSVITACIFEGIGYIFFIVCVSFSVVGRNKPSIFHTMPVNYKKRTLYYFVDILISTLFVIVIIAAFIALLAVIGVIVDAIKGIPLVDDSAEAEEAVDISLSCAAVLFSLFRTLFFCGSITGIMRIENKKHYLIWVLAFILIYVLGGLGLTYAVARESKFTALLWFYSNFENLPLPWLATSLCAVFAIAAWVGSYLYILRIEKPKAY
jgi:hypothetical protein